MLTVVVVEDNEKLRPALVDGLGNTGQVQVVGACESGEEALELCLEREPDAVLMDVQLEGEMNGIEAAVAVRREFPRQPVVFYSIQDDDAYYRAFRRSGILSHYAYVRKSSYLLPGMIVPLLRDAVEGKSFIEPEIEQRVQEVRVKDDQSPMALLEPNEQAVVRMLCMGMTNEQIAARMGFRDKRTISRTNGRIYAAWGLSETATDEKVARTRAVLINAERRTGGVWLAGGALLSGSMFFMLQAAVAWRGMTGIVAALELQWPMGWFIGAVLPVAWYVAILWHAGFWDRDPSPLRRRHVGWLIAVLALMAAVLVLGWKAMIYPWDLQVEGPAPFAEPSVAGVPLLAMGYPVLIVLALALALDVLWHPAPSARPMVSVARRRARAWLAAASISLLVVSVLVGAIMLGVAIGRRPIVPNEWARPLGMPALDAAPPIVWADVVVTGLVMMAVLFLGQAIVSYEIFTGKSLPRGGLKRHWYAAILLAAAYATVAGWSVSVEHAPFYGLLLATLLITAFFALFNWRSYVEHDRHIRRLRPFVASPRVYDALLGEAAPEVDAGAPFQALCAEVLGARSAALVAVGPLAQLADPPLTWPEGAEAPESVAGITDRARSPEQMSLAIEPERYEGAMVAVPLWSERGLIGLLLLGEKAGGGLYTQEEVEIARSVGERLIDTVAVARMSSRLMALQRRRLAEDQVVDRRTRRVLHDEVLPKLHATMLSLSFAEEGGDEEVVERLAEVHSQVSELLHEIPVSDTEELAREGLVATLRRVVEDEFADDFEGIEWRIDAEAERRGRELSDVRAEVLLYAAREAVRNAARHGRGEDPERPLHLSIELAASGGLALTIEDDGVGCADAARADGGHGIALHSTMMAVVGGEWAMESADGRYTRVTLSLPGGGW